MKNYLSVLLFLFLFQSLSAQVIEKAILNQSIKAANDLKDFVAIPNDALNHEDIMKNIAWLDTEFSKRGFKTELLETSNEPLFFAELPKIANAKTLLFYMHLDGQAVDPSKWNQDSPYEVVLKARNEAWE